MSRFLNEEDYDSSMYKEILEAITRYNPAIILEAEDAAQEEMTSYLSARYNTTAIFDARNDERNKLIVLFMKDISLYHLHCISNPRAIPKLREKRYDDAIAWLQSVSKQEINPSLPTPDNDSKDYIRHGSNPKRTSHF
jgi:phage gp36-like protein